jgi:excisionase family DNA binding protein
MEGIPPQLWVTMHQAAWITQRGYSTVRKLVKSGEWPSTKVGGRRLIPMEFVRDIDGWTARQRPVRPCPPLRLLGDACYEQVWVELSDDMPGVVSEHHRPGCDHLAA